MFYPFIRSEGKKIQNRKFAGLDIIEYLKYHITTRPIKSIPPIIVMSSKSWTCTAFIKDIR